MGKYKVQVWGDKNYRYGLIKKHKYGLMKSTGMGK